MLQKSPECGEWLKKNSIQTLPLTNQVVQEAALIKQRLGVIEDNWHPKGVGENDVLIIATAKVSGLQLVSEEGRQFRQPDIISKCKIPAVCQLPEVGVICVQFIELIKASGAKFH